MFFKPLTLFVHRVNQHILFLLDFLQVSNIILCSECLYFCDGDVRFKLNVVGLDFVVVAHQIFELLLSFGYFILEYGHLLFFGVVDFIDLIEFLLGFDSEPLSDVKVIVSLLIIHLVCCQLLLGCVQTDTDLLLILLDFFLLDFGLLKFQLECLFFFEELFVEELLHGGIQWIICSQVFEIIFVLWF